MTAREPAASGPPPVALITTGGTIAERAASATGERHWAADRLLGDLPAQVRAGTVVTRDLFALPSTFMTFERMLEVARAVEAAAADGAAGVVVTHGTDTLEETAYFVDLAVGRAVPVVFSGAMRPPGLPGADGPLNLLDALAVARTPRARDYGVLVVMAGEIHAAREVTKAHTQSVTAFRSLEFGPVGSVEEGRVLFHRALPSSPTIPLRAVTARVEGVKCYAGTSDVVLNALIDARYDGIVLEALGSGQVPPNLMPAIRRAVAAGVTVAAATRCPAGRLIREHYGLPNRVAGDERDLLDAGVLFSALQGPKTRVALAVGLSAGLSRAALNRLLQPAHRGEDPDGPAG